MDLDIILQQSTAKRIANIVQDEKKIADCVGDLSDSLTEYQVSSSSPAAYITDIKLCIDIHAA
jgi:hypothetical protein